MRFPTAVVAFAAAVLSCAPLATAQSTCNAEGFVYDSDGNPLAGVQVLMQYKGHMPQKYRTKTDKNGRFGHVNVWEGPYDLTFSREDLGEVTVNDFAIRQVYAPDKPPTFRIGAKAAPPPDAAEGSAPAGPTREEAAGALAAELEAGNAALEKGDLAAAAAAYESVAAKAPDLPQVHHNLGLVYRRQGDVAKAEAAFRRASELDPAFPEAHGALSVLLATTGRRDEAIVEAEKAVELLPDSTQYLYNLAVLYRDSGRPGDAEPLLVRLEGLDPQNAEIQFHLGTALVALGRMADAVARLEKYVEIAPADAPNRGSAEAMIGALKKKQ
jgi:tetratricopeptide (TPR) repeat protein